MRRLRFSGPSIAYTVIVLCVLIFISLQAVAIGRIDEHQARLRNLSEQNKVLLQQNKVLTEDTIYLADRNIFYTKCIARLFSDYTRTRNPITIERLSKCDYRVGEDSSFFPDMQPTVNGPRQSPYPLLPSSTEPEQAAAASPDQPPSQPPTSPEEPEQPEEPAEPNVVQQLVGLLDELTSPITNLLRGGGDD